MPIRSYSAFEPIEPQFASTYSNAAERESLLPMNKKISRHIAARGHKSKFVVAFLMFAVVCITVLVSTNSSRKIEASRVSDMQSHVTGTKMIIWSTWYWINLFTASQQCMKYSNHWTSSNVEPAGVSASGDEPIPLIPTPIPTVRQEPGIICDFFLNLRPFLHCRYSRMINLL